MMPKLHTIGRVAGKHGYSGEISLALDESNSSEKIKKGNFLFIEFDGKGVPFLIEQFRSASGVVKLADISSTTDAEELQGRNILLEDDDNAAENDNENLIGFEVYQANKKFAGLIKNIEQYPAGPMLMVNFEEHIYMIPWIAEWIIDLDKTKKQLILDFPEDLIDL